MAHMLAVSAFKFSHPLISSVRVKAGDFLHHGEEMECHLSLL